MVTALKGGTKSGNKLELPIPGETGLTAPNRVEVDVPLPPPAAAAAASTPVRRRYLTGRWVDVLTLGFGWLWLAMPVAPWWFWAWLGAPGWVAQTAATAMLFAAAIRLSWEDAGLQLGERVKTWILALVFTCFCWACFPVSVLLAVIGTALHLTLASFKLCQR